MSSLRLKKKRLKTIFFYFNNKVKKIGKNWEKKKLGFEKKRGYTR